MFCYIVQRPALIRKTPMSSSAQRPTNRTKNLVFRRGPHEKNRYKKREISLLSSSTSQSPRHYRIPNPLTIVGSQLFRFKEEMHHRFGADVRLATNDTSQHAQNVSEIRWMDTVSRR